MKRKILILAVIGFAAGLVMGNLIAFFTKSSEAPIVTQVLIERTGGLTAAMIVQTVLSGVYGAAAMSGVIFYDIEEWSLLRAVLSHYSLIMLGFIPLGLVLGWIRPEHFLTDYGAVFIGQTIAFLIIFFIMCARCRAEVKELNRLIEKKDKENNSDKTDGR